MDGLIYHDGKKNKNTLKIVEMDDLRGPPFMKSLICCAVELRIRFFSSNVSGSSYHTDSAIDLCGIAFTLW